MAAVKVKHVPTVRMNEKVSHRIRVIAIAAVASWLSTRAFTDTSVPLIALVPSTLCVNVVVLRVSHRVREHIYFM